MIGVDLFSGAGGLTLGARQAGVNVVFAVESDRHAAATYRANHPDVTLFQDDIRKLRQIPMILKGEPTILFGGPPCQGFSTSNQRTRTKANSANWMFEEFIRLARSWKPDWIVFENVKGITETAKGYFLRRVIMEFEALDYNVIFGFLNAVDFGVPQKRTRLFVIASRHGIRIRMPVGKREPVSVWDAIGDLPKLKNGACVSRLPYRSQATSRYAQQMRGKCMEASGHLVTRNALFVLRRYKHIPQGGNWKDIPLQLMNNYKDPDHCHTGIYHRLIATEPSVVIGNYRKNMLIHPFEDRGLSVREAARLQSFPDSYEFKGSVGFQQQQVANAVPPTLACAVFRRICSQDMLRMEIQRRIRSKPGYSQGFASEIRNRG
jgi:DNA (cytosine-5)-methyltransferase 1